MLFALFLLAGVWRLAYYNLHELDETSGRPCFVGVCTTHAAALLLLVASASVAAGFEPRLTVPGAAGLLAILMVSGLRVPKTGALVIFLLFATPCSVATLFLTHH